MGVPDSLVWSHQIRIGEATAVSLSSGSNTIYPIYYCDRETKLKEVGMVIGHSTIVDKAVPATAYTKWSLWNLTDSTTIVAPVTLLGSGGNTQILPDTYTALATDDTIDSRSLAQCSPADVIGIKFSFTLGGATKGFPYPIAKLEGRFMD